METLEDPKKPWIFFAPGKIPWKILKLQPTPEKSCSEEDFPRINFWPFSAATLFIPVMQQGGIYKVVGGKAVYYVSCGKQLHFPIMDKTFQVKCRMKGV